jgi:hypothetical protein
MILYLTAMGAFIDPLISENDPVLLQGGPCPLCNFLE